MATQCVTAQIEGPPYGLNRLPHLGNSLLQVLIPTEVQSMWKEEAWKTDAGRCARTLVKYPDLRIVLVSMKAGTRFKCKRLTNTPVRQAGSVLKCPDDRKNRVVSAQATYPCGSSAVGGRVCEQRYAAERVLPESRFELQHAGSPSKETALEEKA